jgi:RND family efflux transporter MFP subunit
MMRLPIGVVVAIFMGAAALADPSALVALAVAQQGSLAQEIVAYGTVAPDPNHQMSVVSGHDARVAQVFVRLGQTVRKGDPLVVIQSAPSSAVQFAQAASALAFAAKDLQQTQRLYNEHLATRSQLAAAQRVYADAQATVTQQRLMGADHAMETLTTPVDGVVVTLTAARGDAIAAGATVATIASKGALIVNLGVEPASAADLHPGAAVWLKAPNSTLTIASQMVSVGSMLDSQSRLVDAVARLPDAAATHLLVGTTLSARIALDARRGIVIPRSALLSDRDGTFVLVVVGDVAHRRAVTVAFQTGLSALVVAGLRTGERIVVDGASGLTDGMHVRTR